ncbi:MAG TPA: type II toxin-antitoxin system VapC family toxin [Candidatus Competibacteraceae bacterium]|nr:type II toxin-antitoxin system VapC family toxin [Candidatus Competibacteraceae bacterium]HRZ05579.1 type II toxin-antitoxin system VapC family toxin [Candidatus Competibacteraceae bacterium]HSA46997.1 type II toxin-antitoxin system VapC family toxin [Candidatus Competibacteraceae bacterium]
MGFLIDTNILAELRKRERGNPGVRRWYAGVEESEIYISVIVLGEIRRGVELLRRRDQVAAEGLEVWLNRLRYSLGDRLLPITEAITDCWGRIGIPDPIPVADGLLAATALVHNLTLVTRDTGDVERSGVRLLNPFS